MTMNQKAGREQAHKRSHEQDLPTWELIQRVQAGDRHAGELLCRRYGPRVYRLARRSMGARLRAKLDSDDIVQSSFREIVAQLPHFAYRTEAAFLSWLAKIVDNKIRAAVRYWSAQGRTPEREHAVDVADLVSDAPSPSHEVRRGETVQRLFFAIDRLRDQYRRIVVERMILGLPWEAIAMANHTSVQAAQMLLTRAKRGLARELRRLEV